MIVNRQGKAIHRLPTQYRCALPRTQWQFMNQISYAAISAMPPHIATTKVQLLMMFVASPAMPPEIGTAASTLVSPA